MIRLINVCVHILCMYDQTCVCVLAVIQLINIVV